MVVGGYYSNSLFFFAGNGDGTFQPLVSTPPSRNFSSVLVADFNGDGLLDLADGSLDFVFLGNGDGTFHDGGVHLWKPRTEPQRFTTVPSQI